MPYIWNNGQGTKLVHCFGERDAGLVHHGVVQDFSVLKAECLERRSLFVDPLFEANPNALGPRQTELEVVWKRPREIAASPEFIVDGISRFDINQGKLGDCWFLAALADLTQRPEFISQVIPVGQSFQQDYCGIFHFIFWVAGKWIDVPIDDRLPTIENRLVYTKSTVANEFWGALLEKAYAKMFGNYSALIGGRTSEALQHFTGGVTDFILLKSPNPVATFENLLEMHTQRAFMGAAIFTQEPEHLASLGLVPFHAYSITEIQWVEVNRSYRVPLVRLRNPWGKVEWKGDWCDNSQQWSHVENEMKDRLRVINQEDGEFWMEYKDFVQHFSIVELCHIRFPDSRPGVHEMEGVRLEVDSFHGEWRTPDNAGGSLPSGMYHLNPKMSLDVHDHECRITLALIQKHRRSLRTDEGHNNLAIGFDVFKIIKKQDLKSPMDRTFFDQNLLVETAICIPLHENALQFTAAPGKYTIVLATDLPNIDGQFFARMFVERNTPQNNLPQGEKSWMIRYAKKIPDYTNRLMTEEEVARIWNARKQEAHRN